MLFSRLALRKEPVGFMSSFAACAMSEGSVAPDIYIVGTGIRGADQMTREAEAAIRHSTEVFYVGPKNGVEKYLQELCPKFTDLLPLYQEGVGRLHTYDQMSIAVLDSALEHAPVSFAAYGHPLIYVYPSYQIMTAAPWLSLRVKVLPGISALDCVLVDLGLDPSVSGLQMYEATELLVRRRPLQNDVPCLVWQVGSTEVAYYTEQETTAQQLKRLQSYLLTFYPPDHEATAVFSSPWPEVPSVFHKFPLSEMLTSHALLHQGVTLFIPPVETREIVDIELSQNLEKQLR
jgi:uncharacterized protein YabN with tetrapyrrole methylase and pyrophosphatase domain